MPSYGAESREGYLSSRYTSKWMMSGNHITPINHTFANVFYGCKRILKTFWLISFKYCQWADNDKVSPYETRLNFESRLMQCALQLEFISPASHWHWSQEMQGRVSGERADGGDGRGTSTVIAWHSSAHPLIRQREKPETVQIFGVGVDSVL